MQTDDNVSMTATPPRVVDASAGQRLKLLSFNIQVGLHTAHYGHYVTRAWRHALPGLGPHLGLDTAADLARDYDFVAIQEADAGSLRTRFLNQVEYLARIAGFPYSGYAVTRDLRPVAQHCLGFLSRWPARIVADHALPGPIRGRRTLHVEVQTPNGALAVYVAHLSLGRSTQMEQLHYLAELAGSHAHSIIVGDLNCDPDLLRQHPALSRAGFWLPEQSPLTFPSWAPRRSIDHVLPSRDVAIHSLRALPRALSDHLPLAAEISLREPGA
jgi:endonuclease/exonuclease/phosphatase family metal-dependent hydrolase